MKSFPGKEVIEGLASLKHQIAEGDISPPIKIILERNGDKIVIPFKDLADIDIFGSKDSLTARVSFLIKPGDQWTIKVGKDSKGKPVFLKTFE